MLPKKIDDRQTDVKMDRQTGRLKDIQAAQLIICFFFVPALLYGLLTIGVAYLCGLLSATLLTIVVSVLGMMGGPLLGVILIGLLCPWVNSWVGNVYNSFLDLHWFNLQYFNFTMPWKSYTFSGLQTLNFDFPGLAISCTLKHISC